MLFSIHILQYEQYNLIHSFDNQSRQASSSHSIPNQLLFYYYCKRIICTNSRYLYVWQNKNNRKTKNRHGRILLNFDYCFIRLTTTKMLYLVLRYSRLSPVFFVFLSYYHDDYSLIIVNRIILSISCFQHICLDKTFLADL
jgi:hypothetical protein